jgi:iron complex outermembrane receptor protein
LATTNTTHCASTPHLRLLWVALLVCGAAHAADPPSPAASPGDRQSIDEVVVTGSRIPVSINDEIMPVTVLDSTDLARGGFDSLSKILQTLPMSASSVLNTNVNNGGDGSARVDLRSLQPKRTLVLLNGNRLPNGGIGGDNSVDLNSIPAAMIDRVEVLTTGASAIYGADAVAGVVNFITKPDFNGIDMAAEQSQTYRNDGAISTLTLNAGHEVFGGQWMLGGEYVDQRPVSDSARGYSAVPLTIDDANGDKVQTGSGSLPEGLFIVPDGNAFGLASNAYTHVSGTTGRTAADYRLVNPNTDPYNYAPYNYLQTPNQRSSAWLFGTQPLASNVSLHVEGLFNHRYSSQVIAPTPFNSDLDPAPILADGSPGIPASNYYNPFGVDLSLRRRFVELGNRIDQQRVDMNRELASLSVQEGSWKITPAVSYSHSNATETDIGAIPGQQLATAVGPSGPNAQGQIVCGLPDASGIVPASAIIPGCVPIDLFGGVGSLTQAQLASLRNTLLDHGTDSEWIASIDARGPWGAVPGGPIQWATGAEYRRDEGSYIFDPNRGGGAVGSGGQEDIPEESISAREVYLEMRAPLVRQHPFVEALDLSIGVRYSDFSTFGGHFTWQAGLRWQPLDSWALRTNYARVFRAPSLQELYLAGGVGTDFEFDPCGNNPTPIQRVHCAANGVPGGQYVQVPNLSSTFSVFQGGNPNLGPESGYSFDTGLEWRPADLPNFRATLDYYEINLNGSINDPGTADILQQCADGGRADVCSLIRRAADGNIVSVSAIPRNFGNVVVSGIDMAASGITNRSFGRFKLSIQASYLARHDTQLFPGGDIIREAGTYSTYAAALPRWRSLAHVDFDRGPWHFSYSNQWIGGYTECNFVNFQDGEYCRRVDDVFYQDVEAALTIRTSLTLRLGVNNLTNQQPPFLNFGTDANTDTSTYRLLGRTFFVAVRYKMN